jgi:hypothetical protein
MAQGYEPKTRDQVIDLLHQRYGFNKGMIRVAMGIYEATAVDHKGWTLEGGQQDCIQGYCRILQKMGLSDPKEPFDFRRIWDAETKAKKYALQLKASKRYHDKQRAKGLTSSGLVRKTVDYRLLTGKSLRYWRDQWNNDQIDYESLPTVVKKLIVNKAPNFRRKKSYPGKHCVTREQTGKSLQEWGDEYGISRERVRQLRNKWGTITDELMSERYTGFKPKGPHIKVDK